MSAVKVLIVDNSPVIREKLSKMLSEDPDIEIVGIANGVDNAKEKITALRPDVVMLNLGSKNSSVAYLKTILPQFLLPVVVVTETSADAFNSLVSGTVEFIKMPLIRTASSMNNFMQRLVQQIKLSAKLTVKAAAASSAPTAGANTAETIAKPEARPTVPAKQEPVARPVTQTVQEPASRLTPKPKETPAPEPAPKARVEHIPAEPAAKAASVPETVKPKISLPLGIRGRRHVIALGASTGGTDALQTVLQDLPSDTPGIVIVQHMPEMFTKMYADRLDRVCKMSCVEARDGERLEVGKIILAAGNFHLRLAKDSKGYYVTSQHGEKVSGHCPSVDVLFDSVADVAGKDAIGAIFTGMGADGAVGLKKMRDAGAFTIGQDKESSVVYGMPMVAYNMGAVCLQAPLTKIPQIILENC